MDKLILNTINLIANKAQKEVEIHGYNYITAIENAISYVCSIQNITPENFIKSARKKDDDEL